MWYRNNVTLSTKERILTDIQRAHPSLMRIDHALIVTWYHVGYFNGKTDKVLPL